MISLARVFFIYAPSFAQQQMPNTCRAVLPYVLGIRKISCPCAAVALSPVIAKSRTDEPAEGVAGADIESTPSKLRRDSAVAIRLR